MFRRGLDASDMSEKNVSMCTRASSIRSTYTTSSTKTKYLIPQRIAGGSAVHHPTLQQYNALSSVDLSKNNNVTHNGGTACKQWTTKSTWLFNKTPPGTAARSSIVEWCVAKNASGCPKVFYNNGHSTVTATARLAAPNKSSLAAATSTQVTAESHDDISKKCCCHQYKNNFFASNNVTPRLSNADLEQLQQQAGTASADEEDVDFRKNIIKINKIYNSCRETVYGNGQSVGHDNDDIEEKYSLVDSHGNAMKINVNEDEAIL